MSIFRVSLLTFCIAGPHLVRKCRLKSAKCVKIESALFSRGGRGLGEGAQLAAMSSMFIEDPVFKKTG